MSRGARSEKREKTGLRWMNGRWASDELSTTVAPCKRAAKWAAKQWHKAMTARYTTQEEQWPVGASAATKIKPSRLHEKDGVKGWDEIELWWTLNELPLKMCAGAVASAEEITFARDGSRKIQMHQVNETETMPNGRTMERSHSWCSKRDNGMDQEAHRKKSIARKQVTTDGSCLQQCGDWKPSEVPCDLFFYFFPF